MIWIEDSTRWAVRGYHWANGLNLVGRKDRVRFGVDIPEWIGSGREMPAEYRMPGEPQFLRADDAIYHMGGRLDLQLANVTCRTYKGTVNNQPVTGQGAT